MLHSWGTNYPVSPPSSSSFNGIGWTMLSASSFLSASFFLHPAVTADLLTHPCLCSLAAGVGSDHGAPLMRFDCFYTCAFMWPRGISPQIYQKKKHISMRGVKGNDTRQLEAHWYIGRYSHRKLHFVNYWLLKSLKIPTECVAWRKPSFFKRILFMWNKTILKVVSKMCAYHIR